MSSAYPILLFLLPFGGALLCGIAGWWRRGTARAIALFVLAAMSVLSVQAAAATFAAGRLHSHLGGWAPPLGIELALDPLSALMAVLVACTAFVVLAGSGAAARATLAGRETAFHALSLMLVAGLTGMVVTADLFNLFVHLEVTSLSAYALAGTGPRGAARAGLNYLLIGSLGASFYLLGVGFVYSGTGTLNMADAAARLTAAPTLLAGTGLALVVAGLGVKMALFPLHGWMAPAYAATTPAAAALMAPLVTKVAAYALLRILFWVYASAAIRPAVVMELLGIAGSAAIVAGGVLAFLQQDLRRMLAYSSVSQVGIVAVGIALANEAGLTGAVLHLGNDALAKGALFLAAGALLVRSGVSRVDQLARLRGSAPWTTAVLAVAGVSLIGLPPLAGFFGKWYVLLGALEAGRWLYVAALALGTVLTAAYVFRLLEPLLFGHAKNDDAVVAAVASPDRGAALASALAFTVLIVIAGVLNGPLSALVRIALPEGVAP